MALDIWIPISVWLAIGAAIAFYLYRLMYKEGKVERLWLLIGFALSVLGLMAFIGVRSMREKNRDKAVDPNIFQPPEYKMSEGLEEKPKEERRPEPEPRPKREVKRIEGIPRCPECGAAVSSLDALCRDCGAKLKE